MDPAKLARQIEALKNRLNATNTAFQALQNAVSDQPISRLALPPTSLDWLLRTDDQVDSLEDWYRDVTDRKKDVATCEHGDTLHRFHAACPTRDDRVCPALAHRDGLDRPWT